MQLLAAKLHTTRVKAGTTRKLLSLSIHIVWSTACFFHQFFKLPYPKGCSLIHLICHLMYTSVRTYCGRSLQSTVIQSIMSPPFHVYSHVRSTHHTANIFIHSFVSDIGMEHKLSNKHFCSIHFYIIQSILFWVVGRYSNLSGGLKYRSHRGGITVPIFSLKNGVISRRGF